MQPCSAFQTAPPFVNPHTLPRQDGEIHVSINSGVLIIPKVFLNQSDESEEAAKELTINVAKTDAKTDAKDEPKKSAAVKLVGTKQKVKKQAEAAIEAAKNEAPKHETVKKVAVRKKEAVEKVAQKSAVEEVAQKSAAPKEAEAAIGAGQVASADDAVPAEATVQMLVGLATVAAPHRPAWLRAVGSDGPE